MLHTRRLLSAGFLQFDVQLGDIAANLRKVTTGLNNLGPNPPGIIVLPEMWSTGFAYRNLPTLARQIPEVLGELQRLSAERQIFLAGSLPEMGLDEKTIYNTLFITGSAGVIGHYRKQRLFAPIGEDKHLTPGKSPLPIDTPLGRIAGLVCYDLRFPELLRTQTAQGANILIVSAQWPLSRIDHWRTLLMARAIENQIFVIAANRCGTDSAAGGATYGGRSLIIAPDGEIVHEAGGEEEHGYLTIDLTLVDEVRARFNTVAAV